MSKKPIPQDALIPKKIAALIYEIRGQKVMLDEDIARLYGVETRALNQAVSRNKDRFPDDFMFRISKEEAENLKSQNVTSSWGGRRRSLPRAFTEQGVAMLSSVLRSKRAVAVNIAIMRAFVRMREFLGTQEIVRKKIGQLERQVGTHDKQIKQIFDALRVLTAPEDRPRRKIGF